MDLFDDFVETTMEGPGATGAQGSAPVAGAAEPDPNWQPV
jgi:hypothetical protein